jgi:RNase P protein component
MHTPQDYAAVFGARNRVIRGLCFDVLRGSPGKLLLGPLAASRAGKDESPESLLECISPGAPRCPRLGLIVPKRLARRAVLRNTIKRQVREVFRVIDQTTLPAVDLVFRLTRWPQDVAMLAGAPLVLKRMLRQEIEGLLLKIQSLPEVANQESFRG